MKLRIILALIILFVSSLSMEAQKQKPRFDVEKHRQEQADFFTKELALTEKEQQEFLPLLQEYMLARYLINKEARDAGKALRGNKNRLEAECQKVIDLIVEAKIKEADLLKEYYKKFGAVLPAEKILKFHGAEVAYMQKAVQRHRSQSRGGADK